MKDSLEGHRRQFGQAPELLAVDRGLSSVANARRARQTGLKRVAMPSLGRAAPERRCQEQEGGFRRGYRFRAGIEGRIPALRRDEGLKWCRSHSEPGLGRWVGCIEWTT